MMSNYLDNYSQRLVTALHLNVTRTKERLTLDEIISGSFPEMLQACAKTYAHRLFNLNKPLKLNGNERYHFQDTVRLARKLEVMDDFLIGGFLFTEDEITQLVDYSVKLQFSIIIRPRHTLSEMLFNVRNERSVDDVVVVAQGFGSSRPFITKLVHALQAERHDSIDHAGFENLARRIEQKIYKETPISALINDLQLLLEFESAVIEEKTPRVRTELLLTMLAERELQDLFDEIRRRESETQFWTLDEIEYALERFLLVGPFENSEEAEHEDTEVASFDSLFNESIALGDLDSFNGFGK